jgi:predicted Fe-S protein YdhL (DUF1289 family)
MVSSPCIKICTMDAASRLCVGCGRSLEEIARWGSMSEAERLEIMHALPERMRAANLKPQQGTTP